MNAGWKRQWHSSREVIFGIFKILPLNLHLCFFWKLLFVSSCDLCFSDYHSKTTKWIQKPNNQTFPSSYTFLLFSHFKSPLFSKVSSNYELRTKQRIEWLFFRSQKYYFSWMFLTEEAFGLCERCCRLWARQPSFQSLSIICPSVTVDVLPYCVLCAADFNFILLNRTALWCPH